MGVHMTNPTIQEVMERKKEMEKSILAIISEYEKATGLTVDGVLLYHEEALAVPRRTAAVKTQVGLSI